MNEFDKKFFADQQAKRDAERQALADLERQRHERDFEFKPGIGWVARSYGAPIPTKK